MTANDRDGPQGDRTQRMALKRLAGPSDPDVAKILMVDDRPEDLTALEALLAPLGHGLVKAHSGEEALGHLLRDEFALILLDVQMPGMDGFETAAQIKQRTKTRHVPIIFVTAFDEDRSKRCVATRSVRSTTSPSPSIPPSCARRSRFSWTCTG